MVQTQNNLIKRRIEFFELFYYDINDEKIIIAFDELYDIFQSIKQEIDLFEFTDNSRYRWYGIDNINLNESTIEIVLKNCMFQYSPDIININSKDERPNNRGLDEGDKEKTHCLITKNNIMYEKKRNGTPFSVLKLFINSYINKSEKEKYEDIKRVEHSLVMVNDFMKVFEESTRIKNVNITVDKSHDLDEFSRFHNDDNVKETYSITYKAKRSKSINKETIRYYLNKFVKGEDFVEKITMDIDNDEEDAMTINTEQFAKHAYIDVIKDSKGVANTIDMFAKMNEL